MFSQSSSIPIDPPSAPGSMDTRRDRESRLRMWRGLLLLVILLGIGFRLVQFAWRTSLWHDEALIVLNVMHRDWRGLLRPLDYEQAAPPMFLWIERAILLHLGFGEDRLRLVSIVCGTLSVPLFAWLVWRRFPAPVAVAAAALFAFCDKLIWHSAEVKQYSGDVFVAVALLFLATGLRRPVRTVGRLWLIAIASAVLLWFSFPAVFVFGAISLMLCVRLLTHARRPSRFIAAVDFIAANAIVLASFALLYALTVRGHAGYLDDYWSQHLADWHRPLAIPWWIVREIYSLCDHPFRSLGWLMLPLAIAGAVRFARSRRFDLLWVTLGPAAFCLIAALADKYPFTGERITLFLAPGLFILVAGALEWMLIEPRFRRGWFVPALPMIVLGLVLAIGHLFHPHSRSSMRPIARYLKEHREPDQAICLVGEGTSPTAHFRSGRDLELLCYWPDVPGPLYGAPGTPPLRDVSEIRERSFWIVYAALPEHGDRYMRGLLDEARSIARQVESRQIPGGGAVLFQKR